MNEDLAADQPVDLPRSLYLGKNARRLAVECGYRSPELRPCVNGLVRLTLRGSDIDAFTVLCREQGISDFK
jgi:hypothetical protein